MTRDEALERFKSEEATRIFQQTNQKVRDELIEKRDQYKDALREAFWKILESAKDYPGFQVQEVQFCYLQVHVMDGTYQWRVELHDDKGDFVETEISDIFDMKEFFASYEACRNELYQEASKYVSTLTPSDCDVLMIDNFKKLVPYLELLGVYAFRGIDEDARFQGVAINKIFRVLVGGRRDTAFVAFYKLEKPEDQEKIKEKITGMPKEKDFTGSELALFDFSGYHFEECNISLRSLQFANFRNSSFQDVEMLACKCMMSDWREAEIKDAIFDGNIFNGSDFSYATIENTSFIGARFDVTPDIEDIPVNPTLIPVKFYKTKFDNVDFRGSFLSGCDFSGAEIGKADFENADLRNTKFSIKYRDVLTLTDEQKQEICWVKD